MYFDTLAKLAKIRAGTTENVWVDPLGYQAAAAERKAAFDAELMRQKQGSAGQNSAHNRRKSHYRPDFFKRRPILSPGLLPIGHAVRDQLALPGFPQIGHAARDSDDIPTIGLVLCTAKNDAVVQYVLDDKSRQIFASRYQFQLPSEETLKNELEREMKALQDAGGPPA